MKRNDNLRELWGNIKCTDIYIKVVPEEEKRDMGTKNVLEEIMAKNFSNLSKKTDIQIQKTQCCKKMNPERLTLRNIIFKMAKV